MAPRLDRLLAVRGLFNRGFDAIVVWLERDELCSHLYCTAISLQMRAQDVICAVPRDELDVVLESNLSGESVMCVASGVGSSRSYGF